MHETLTLADGLSVGKGKRESRAFERSYFFTSVAPASGRGKLTENLFVFVAGTYRADLFARDTNDTGFPIVRKYLRLAVRLITAYRCAEGVGRLLHDYPPVYVAPSERLQTSFLLHPTSTLFSSALTQSPWVLIYIISHRFLATVSFARPLDPLSPSPSSSRLQNNWDF